MGRVPRLLLLAGCAAALLAAAGCGGANDAGNDTTVAPSALQARVLAAGYTVRTDLQAPAARPLPSEWFDVVDVDWARPGKTSFSVAVYAFGSRKAARRFAKGVEKAFAEVGAPLTESAGRRRLEQRNARVYVGYSTMSAPLCAELGVCRFHAAYAIASCIVTGSTVRCPSQAGAVPVAAFERVVAVAEGRHPV